MKESPANVLNEVDMEFAETLRSLDVPRNVALLIAYLKNVPSAPSREIEICTGLRQPEVSVGMKTLKDMNWVEEFEVKREGKGRPTKNYTLNTPLETIIGYFEQQKISESNRAMEYIHRLKKLSSV